MNYVSRSWSVIGGLVGLVIAIEVTRHFLGLPMALLLCAGVLLVSVVMLMWHSLQALDGDATMSLEEALTLAAPPAEEEQKRAALRSLKDLEFERHMGKVRDEDYAALAARYRSEARALLGQLDARYESVRGRIAAELAAQLDEQDGDGPTGSQPAKVVESATEPKSQVKTTTKRTKGSRKRGGKSPEVTARSVPTRTCRSCGVRNVLALHECKECGAALAVDGERLCLACPSRYQSSLSACPNCGVLAEKS